MKVPCKNIPTYNILTKEWSTTSFASQIEFGHTLLNDYFKEPGKYEFDEDTQIIASLGKFWEKNKYYTTLADGTSDSNKFWKDEEYKSRLGVFLIKGDKKWYFTRDYYFFLNYCPIINKEKGQEETMASLRDGQYHMMMYEKIAELFHLHSCILKRRQMAFSLCHVAKTINFIYFENKKTIKWFASNEDFIDSISGSWKYLNAYINHLNIYTVWAKDFNPGTYPKIQQTTKIQQGKTNRWVSDGNDSTLVAQTLAKDPKKGVGQAGFWFWYEEGGIAPTADETLTYINPALESGLEKVGSFCIGGSVGDLKQCKPLKEFLLNPRTYDFLGVPTNLYDDNGIEKICGLFIPAQWGMPQATDQWGNSLPELALELLHKAEFIGFKAGEDGRIQDEEPWINLPEKQYIIKKSQNPKNIKEAFAYREESKFPIKRIEKQQSYIKDHPEFAPKKVELWEDENGKIKYKPCDKEDVPYPVDPKLKDKNGVVLMWKPPGDRVELFTYFAGVDNVEVGKSDSSSSLYSIYVVEGCTEEVYYTEEGHEKVRLIGDRIVASWTGRFDNLDDTNRQGEYLIRLYNAFTLCERNKPNFITHMIKAGYRSLLATQGDVPIYKEVSDVIDTSKNADIGIHMDASHAKHDIADNYLYQWLVTEVDAKYKLDKNGNPTEEKVKTWYNLNYIYDYNLFEELKNDKENTDRRDALRLAIMLKTVYGAKGIKKKRINTENKPFVEKVKLSPNINYLNGINSLDYGKKRSSETINYLS